MSDATQRTGSLRRWPPAVGVGLLSCLLAAAAAADSHLVFDRSDVLELTLETPMRTLLVRGKSGVELDVTVRLDGDGSFAARLKTFGKSRLKECRFPPLVLSVEPGAADGTPFEGQTTLRLVTHCRVGSTYERTLLLEYLAYRAYSLVAAPALGARLTSVRYVDSEGRRDTEVHPGFFVEDIGHAASRLGLEWSRAENQRLAETDPAPAALYVLFQYMIGNSDWSFMTGPSGERCCHNTALLEGASGEPRLLLPYDFDQAGVVGAPYAEPSEKLGIRSVSERVYRGFCVHNDQVPAAIERLEARRGDLEALFLDDSLPDEKARRKAWTYLAGFYDLIDDPRQLATKILGRCRSSG